MAFHLVHLIFSKDCVYFTFKNVKLIFNHFSIKSQVVGTRKNPLNEKCRLSHEVTSGSDITPCNKIDKPLVVYRLARNVMTAIIMLRKRS